MTPKKKRFLIISFVFASILLIAGAFIWYLNRPIAPVILTENEKEVLETKIQTAQATTAENPTYQAGSKTLLLSERELNGLFHSSTDLGEQLRFELADGAIHARVQHQLDQDFPIFPGKKIKGKARLLIQDKTAENPHPEVILDDVTLWGISIPNAWLGELKGKNLFEQLGSGLEENAFSKGIKSLKVVPGALEIQFAE